MASAPVSVPHLFALAHGSDCVGAHRCVFCAAPCDGQFRAADFLKDSFTGRDTLPCPGSPFVCRGCVLCLREAADVPMLDGTVRRVTKCAMRGWSWEVTASRARAGSKADLAHWRALCLTPPAPPFALVLSDSGQKQLLYRGAVCHSREVVTVTLETERVTFAPAGLRARLDLCGRLIAATGKPALAERPTVRFCLAVMERYPTDGERLLLAWEDVREMPLSRLAAWLSPGRDECRAAYPAGPAAAVV